MNASVAWRAPTDTDAVLGALPERVYEPATADELADIVASTAGSGFVVSALGGGGATGLGNPLERYDVAIRTRRLNRIVDYTPEDQIVVVEAGVTLDELQMVLWRHRQRLAIDPPAGETRTIGGLLATNAYGPSVVRTGTLKDLIVGIEMVRADGTVVRGGGKVVKNVAGFDVPKLMVGSLGTLGIITKATFRVHPRPEAQRTIAVQLPGDRVFPFVLALRERRLEPSSIVAQLDESPGDAAVWLVSATFEGFAAGVAAQALACTGIARTYGELATHPAGSIAGADIVAKATYRPDAFDTVRALCEGRGFWVSAYPATGTLRIRARSAEIPAPEMVAAELRAVFEALGGNLVFERMPRRLYDAVDPWGTPPPSFAVMRALKERFDPDRRLNRGRFVGGL